MAALLHKIEFVCGIIFYAVQRVYVLLHLNHMFLAEFSVIHLVVIPFKIELINFYEFSCLLLVFYLVLDTFVFFLVTVLTVASSSVFVSLVICKAEPAKLMFALSARHVITTLIFFNQFPAFRIWTFLSKSFQPSQVF